MEKIVNNSENLNETPETLETAKPYHVPEEPFWFPRKMIQALYGETELISGPTGSGKSFLAEILLKYHESPEIQKNLRDLSENSQQMSVLENLSLKYVSVIPDDPTKIPQNLLQKLQDGELTTQKFWLLLINAALTGEEIPDSPTEKELENLKLAEFPKNDITLLFDHLHFIPVENQYFTSLIQSLGYLIQDIPYRIKIFVLPSWRGMLPSWKTVNIHWSFGLHRSLWLFHLHEDGASMPEALINPGKSQAQAADTFLDPRSEKILNTYLTDPHGDIPPMELLEAIVNVSEKQEGEFFGPMDPLAQEMADYHRKQMKIRHPDCEKLLATLKPGSKNPIVWYDFLDQDLKIQEIQNFQLEVQKVLEIGAISRVDPRKEVKGREYLIPAINHKAFNLDPNPKDIVRNPNFSKFKTS